MLYVATAELRAFKAQRFAANERDGLGLDLAYMPSGLFAIHKSFDCCVSENNVSLCSGAHKLTYVAMRIMWRNDPKLGVFALPWTS
jgi:hypothetical protein